MLAAYLLLNLPFWFLAYTDYLNRPWLNLDLAIPLAIAPFSIIAATIVLATLWILDLAVSQSLAWHFHSPYEFIRSVEFAPSINFSTYLSDSSAVRVVVFVVCGLFAIRMTQKIRRAPLLVSALILVIGTADALNGSSILWSRVDRLVPGNVAGSAVKTTGVSMLRIDGTVPRQMADRIALTAKVDVLGYAKAHPERSILLIVVESMGLIEDPALRQAMRARLVDDRILSRFDIADFSVPFRGSTVNGELRELCHLEGNYRLLDRVKQLRCLPRQLDDLGWTTVGLHGFSHRMFMRGAWWPSTGLQRGLFAEDLGARGQARCGGAFVGICDGILVRRAVQEAHEPKHFVYALTLNSHLPLETIRSDPVTQRVCDLNRIDAFSCALVSTIGVALDALRTSLDDEANPPLVLVVGDHAPPFTASSSRAQFSQTLVPGIALIPKARSSSQ